MTVTTTPAWLAFWQVRPGDQVKVPGGSRTCFATRTEAEFFPTPYRTVARIVRGERMANGQALPGARQGYLSIWFEDGRFGCYFEDWKTLVIRAEDAA